MQALGAKVTAISRSGAKRSFALEELGCDAFVAMDTPSDVQANAKTLDVILSTVNHNLAQHDMT